MTSVMRRLSALRETGGLALRALRSWTPRQVFVAGMASLAVAMVVGVATVLIPNPLFGRDIPPVWWNYPVWLATSVMAGMLVATYVRLDPAVALDAAVARDAEADGPADSDQGDARSSGAGNERGTSRMGVAGGVLAWFAVGCPVCNKLALVALGYSGAITWFAPVQPFLALGALVLTGSALVWRLRGQTACPAPRPTMEVAR